MKRDRKVSVRMTDDELQEVRKKAERHALSISRFLLLQGLERPVYYKTERSVEKDEILYQLASLKNSLYKCLRLVRTGKVRAVEEEELKILIQEINDYWHNNFRKVAMNDSQDA